MSESAPRISGDHPAVHSAAKIIARELRHREEQIRRGTVGDVQTKTPNGIAEELVTAILPLLCGGLEEDEKQRGSEGLRWTLTRRHSKEEWIGGHLNANVEVIGDDLLRQTMVMPVAEHEAALEKAEQELERVRANHLATRKRFHEEKGRADRAEAKLSQVREEVERLLMALQLRAAVKVLSPLPQFNSNSGDVEERGEGEVAERVARAFHGVYETLAPEFGYESRPESRVPWSEVPEKNRALMIGTVRRLILTGVISTTSNSLPREPGDREPNIEGVARAFHETYEGARGLIDVPSPQPNPEPHLSPAEAVIVSRLSRLERCPCEGRDGGCPECTNGYLRPPSPRVEPHLSGDGERLKSLFFDALDERVRVRQQEVEPEGVPTIHLSDVHAALNTFLRDLASRLSSEDSSKCRCGYEECKPWCRQSEDSSGVEEAMRALAAKLEDEAARSVSGLMESVRAETRRHVASRIRRTLTQPDSTTRQVRSAEAQRWLDEDVKNQAEIERLEGRNDELADALLPFIEAKPLPGGEDDHYRIYISGEVRRAAKAAYEGSASTTRLSEGTEQ